MSEPRLVPALCFLVAAVAAIAAAPNVVGWISYAHVEHPAYCAQRGGWPGLNESACNKWEACENQECETYYPGGWARINDKEGPKEPRVQYDPPVEFKAAIWSPLSCAEGYSGPASTVIRDDGVELELMCPHTRDELAAELHEFCSPMCTLERVNDQSGAGRSLSSAPNAGPVVTVPGP